VAINLGSIVVSLEANVANFLDGLSKSAHQSKQATKEIHRSFDEMGQKIGGALNGLFGQFGQFGQMASEMSSAVAELSSSFGKSGNAIAATIGGLGALGAAAIGAGIGLAELGREGAELVEHFQKVSEKTGIGVRDLQILEAAGKTVGVSLDEMVVGMKRLDQALLNTGKGAAAQGVLNTLGVTAKDNKEAILQIADAFEKMEDGPRKASDAVALFGKSGMSLIPILNKGRTGISEFEEMVDKYGPKIGKEAVHANEEYRKSVEQLSLQWDKFKVDAEVAIIPTLAKIAKAIDFQAIKAGIVGASLGANSAAMMLQDQKSANETATAAAKKESAAKDESLRKQEQLTNSLKESYEVMRLGGTAAYKLSQARLELEGATQNGLWKQAATIQSQLPGLEKAAALEAQRAARVKQLAESYASMQKFFDGGAIVKPLLKIGPTDTTKGIEALFGPQPKNPLEGAPDIGHPQFADLSHALDGLQKDLSMGTKALEDFYREWNGQARGTAASISLSYDQQLAHFDGLLHLGQISQAQFNDVSLKLEAQRQEGLKKLRMDTGASTFRDAWQDMFQQIEASGKDFARSIVSDIGFSIDHLNQQLAQFVATGKGLSLKEIGKTFEANIFGSILRKGESSLAGSIGKMFGLGGLGGKRDGSSANNALYVQVAGATGAGAIGSLPLGNFGAIANSLGKSSSGSGFFGGLSGIFSKIGGSIGGIFGKLFGGFRADGGSVDAGRAYVVGEKRPELFIPRMAGTIVKNVSSSDTKSVNIVNQLHVHGVTDADSFRKSQHQILTALSRGQGLAASRA
jgi:hypothetical protein